MVGEKMEQKELHFVFWVFSKKKYLSLYFRNGYEAVVSKTSEEMWNLIHQYIEVGYKVH